MLSRFSSRLNIRNHIRDARDVVFALNYFTLQSVHARYFADSSPSSEVGEHEKKIKVDQHVRDPEPPVKPVTPPAPSQLPHHNQQVSSSETSVGFCTTFSAILAPALCSSVCLLVLSLPYLVIPAVKGPNDEFCSGYWKIRPESQLGGRVTCILKICTH